MNYLKIYLKKNWKGFSFDKTADISFSDNGHHISYNKNTASLKPGEFSTHQLRLLAYCIKVIFVKLKPTLERQKSSHTSSNRNFTENTPDTQLSSFSMAWSHTPYKKEGQKNLNFFF